MKEYEEQVRQAEEDLIVNTTDENRAKLYALNAEYIKFLKVEEFILKQKTYFIGL